MTQPIQTHINAFYADLVVAKREEAVSHQKVVELENTIVARGYQLPNSDGSFPDPDTRVEDVVHSNDVSATEQIPSKDKK